MKILTFLTKEQCFGDNKLEIFKKRNAEAEITDFSILQGGWTNYYNDNSEYFLKRRRGLYWTKSKGTDNKICYVDNFGKIHSIDANKRMTGIRLATKFLEIGSIPTNGKRGNWKEDGILEVEYGYYPQNAVQRNMQLQLEKLFQDNNIIKTGNRYTTDLEYGKNENKEYEEYEYNEKRYVRVKANFFSSTDEVVLSNGERCNNGDFIWVGVSPVKWLVDERSKIMVTDKIILAGIPFNDLNNYYSEEDFEKTYIKKFTNIYLSRELEQSIKRQEIKLHQIEEIKEYENKGIKAFKEIGKMYSSYLEKENEKEERDK